MVDTLVDKIFNAGVHWDDRLQGGPHGETGAEVSQKLASDCSLSHFSVLGTFIIHRFFSFFFFLGGVGECLGITWFWGKGGTIEYNCQWGAGRGVINILQSLGEDQVNLIVIQTKSSSALPPLPLVNDDRSLMQKQEIFLTSKFWIKTLD